ncbi:MAG: HAMP domain-containing histidine kinase, partial [Gammaproteobacteria bacterium]
AQQQLLVSARKVGMAEVANNVLHNIGNVLNSVNVSAELLNEKIVHSPLDNLVKVGDLLNANKDNLNTFITQDAQGERVPKFFMALADYWKDEKATISKELGQLANHIEHIKNIIATQQSLSGDTRFEQITDIGATIEEVLQITEITEDGVTIKKDYDKLSPVQIDKIKLMQILVNLLHNAKDALDKTSIPDKLVTIKIKLKPDEKLMIEVRDNGVGIPSENLERIFLHGFTTKLQGHGFGLHSAALAAKEMDGSLAVHSDGVGKGATFTLEVPYKVVAKANA